MMWSQVLRFSANQEAFLDAGRIDALRARLAAPSGAFDRCADGAPGTVQEALERVDRWRDVQHARYARLLDATLSEADVAILVRSLLLGSAPFATVLGACLQGLSAPGVFEDPVHLRLLALLADDVGVGRAESARADEFRQLMRRFGLAEHAVSTYDLSFVGAIDECLFALPAVLLAMSRRSDQYGPELCAIDLVLRATGLQPAWAALQTRYPDRIDWRRLDLAIAGDARIVADPLVASRHVVERCVASGPELARRVHAALDWAVAALAAWNDSLFDYVTAALDPHQAMENLVRRRARDASVYHNDYELGGCPLAARFKQAVADPAPLVAALADSRLVVPAAASKSVLVNGLLGPRGKMFRVFNGDEVAVMRRWIDALPARASAPVRQAVPRPAQAGACPVRTHELLGQGCVDQQGAEPGAQPGSVREAYFLLQGRALAPRLRSFALDYVESWMRGARRAAGDRQDSLPQHWLPGGLRTWLDEQHDKAGHGFQESADAELPDREAVVDSTLQLAPLLCIDGAWLQGFTDIQYASSSTTCALFEIYWDELGNGEYELNHPKIYRDLMRQMDVELPPTGSRAFALDPRLRDESFRLPVLWLCLGKLPSTFLPEIMGMNLAMELSGVGGGYRSAHRFLKLHGFSTQFVDLHNTIDNVATGHSGKAAEAVDKYMRTQVPHCDAAALAAQWERIRTGYNALTSFPTKTASWLRNFRLARRAKGAAGAALLHHDWLAPAP